MRVSLPFPRCHSCGRQWGQSRHRGCGPDDLQVDSSDETVYCPSCGKEWHLWDTVFCCACGTTFHAAEVQDALAIDALIRSHVRQHLDSMMRDEKRITQAARSSLREFLGGLGFTLGSIGGRLVRLVR